MADDLEYRIAKLDLGPDDVLVVKYHGEITIGSVRSINDTAQACAPGVRVLFIGDDLDLSVLTRDEINARAGDVPSRRG